MGERRISKREAAEYCECSQRSLERAVKAGKFTSVEIADGKLWLLLSEVKAYRAGFRKHTNPLVTALSYTRQLCEEFSSHG
jgi:hypothetical protein